MDKTTLKAYYSLTKPGVLYGNVLTGAAGFLLAAASLRRFDGWLFAAVIIGMTLVIASACALNNVLDRDIDSLMERTKTRAVASGTVTPRNAMIFSIILGIAGLTLLCLFANWWVVASGVAGYVVYVWLYGALSKRLSVHGTLVGSVSGAMPILAGYVAVVNALDAGAIIVFAILFFWQLPEFYSIAIYRRAEYKAAGVPVMSVVHGVESTRKQIVWYTAACVISMLLLTPFGYTGYLYLAVMVALGFYWLRLGLQGFKTADVDSWARRMFHFSLIILLVLCLMLAVGPLLP